VALCLLLLVGAGLGFQHDHLLQFSIQPGLNGYQRARLAGYYEELQQRIRATPGVLSVGLSQHALIGGGVSTSSAVIPGYTSGKRRVDVYRNGVGPGFFETMGIPLVLGRAIGARDGALAPKVAVVNERLVKDYVHGGNPIGHRVRFWQCGPPKRFRDCRRGQGRQV